MRSSQITRRTFIKGAGLVAVAAAGRIMTSTRGGGMKNSEPLKAD